MEDFSKEMEYGNYLDFDRFPLDCESVAMMQSTLRHYAAIAQIAGYDFLILSGCQESGGYRGEGYVFVKENGSMTGEVLFHPKAAPQSTCSVREETYNVSADGETFFNAYSKRRLIEGGSQFYWSNAGRLSEVSNKALKARIENEENERKNTVNNLTATVTNEYKAAIKAAIDNEAAARQNADSALNSAISNEATARANADSTEKAARENADSGLNTAISNEATARANADSALNSAISNEATARANADSTEKAARENADSGLNTAISNEATARANADSELSRRIDELSVVPKGVIVMWSGYDKDIPTGWALCNGQNGTPDLRYRFVMGAQDGRVNDEGYGVDERWRTGEKFDSNYETSFSLHSNNLPKHTHRLISSELISGGYALRAVNCGMEEVGDGGTGAKAWNTGSADNRAVTETQENDTLGLAVKVRIPMPNTYVLAFIMKL